MTRTNKKNNKAQEQETIAPIKKVSLHKSPKTFFLAYDDAGDKKPHWFDSDPLNQDVRKEIDMNKYLVDYYGKGNASFAEPIAIRFYGAAVERVKKFNAFTAERYFASDSQIDICDFEGNIVDLVRKTSKNPEFPLIGVVFDNEHNVKEVRLYSPSGKCEDGNEHHDLFETKKITFADVNDNVQEPED